MITYGQWLVTLLFIVDILMYNFKYYTIFRELLAVITILIVFKETNHGLDNTFAFAIKRSLGMGLFIYGIMNRGFVDWDLLPVLWSVFIMAVITELDQKDRAFEGYFKGIHVLMLAIIFLNIRPRDDDVLMFPLGLPVK
jgi:hypothetical protein